MAIKKVDQVPMTLQEQRQSYRDMIRKDLEDAIEQRIDKFEFDGDYNYKYLANYAREEAEWVFRRKIYRPAAKRVAETLQKEFGRERVFAESEWRYRGRYIRIKSLKGEDKQHVYAEIDFSQEEQFYNDLLTDTRAMYKEIAEREKLREERRKEAENDSDS